MSSSLGRTRSAAIAILSLRVAYGLALILAPGRVARRWLGSAAHAAPTQVALRGIGAREIGLHAGALAATLSGQAVRPWLAASMVGDLTDVAGTVCAAEGLPRGSAIATLIVGGGSAALSAGLAAALDR